jgi:type IV pilus assembly protein PilW
MTLIELLVAMVIGLGVTLAVTSMLITSENQKRTTTSTNDAEQTGAFAFSALNETLRSAGSGIAESAYLTDKGIFGCRLNAAGILPRAGAFPAPFATTFLGGVGNTLRTAPLLIAKGQSDAGSDVLVVMSASGSAGGVSRQITGAGSATSLILDNTVGFNTSDLVLVSQSGTTDCLVEEVTTVNPTSLTIATTGTYYTLGTTTTIGTLSGSTASYVTPLGNALSNNVQFQLIGVGANRTLYSYDLLQNVKLVQGVGGDVSQAIADGVQELHAIYGISTTGTNVQNNWANPGVAPYDITSLMAAPGSLGKILSVRVALVLRGEYYDKNVVSPATLTLFSGYTDYNGASLAQVIALSATDQHYRYRVFEFTVPLRDMIILAT